MSRGAVAQARKLFDSAMSLPYGPARVAVLEEAVARADSAGDIALGYEFREQLTDTAVMSGRGDLLITHFSWSLAQFDRTPDRFDEHHLLWRYKWVASNLLSFPDIPLDHIERLLDDMEARFQRYGANGRTIFEYRKGLAIHVGDKPKAKEWFAKLQATPRDVLSNCPACELNSVVRFHIYLGRNRQGVDAARDILNGRLRCRAVPKNTYANLLIPALKLNDVSLAADYHRAGLRLLLNDPEGIWAAGCHLKFLGLTGNHTAGLRLLTKYLPLAYVDYEPSNQFDFYVGTWVFLDQLRRAGSNPRIRIPPEHPLSTGKKSPTADVLLAWCQNEAEALAARFDARNGTPEFARQFRVAQSLHNLAVDYPLVSQDN